MKVLNTNFRLEDFFDTIKDRSLLMLDYDGTLAPFVINRTQAYPYPQIISYLANMKHLNNMRIVIISGRELSELQNLLGSVSDHLELWGSHGLERKLSNGERSVIPLEPSTFKGLEKGLKISRAIVVPSEHEIKKFSVAVHWRGLPFSRITTIRERLIPLWEKLCCDYPLEIHYFDGGIELRPKNKNKALAVKKLLKEIPPNTTIAYFGDDITDEEAFQAIDHHGLKVLVREGLRPTLADIQLTPPHELLDFLEQWKEIYAPRF